jgi:23S rRNA (uridine2552-2'-O)-methyltransferase
MKAFHGEAFEELLKRLKKAFRSVKVLKPAASRGESAETYLVARGLSVVLREKRRNMKALASVRAAVSPRKESSL